MNLSKKKRKKDIRQKANPAEATIQLRESHARALEKLSMSKKKELRRHCHSHEQQWISFACRHFSFPTWNSLLHSVSCFTHRLILRNPVTVPLFTPSIPCSASQTDLSNRWLEWPNVRLLPFFLSFQSLMIDPLQRRQLYRDDEVLRDGFYLQSHIEFSISFLPFLVIPSHVLLSHSSNITPCLRLYSYSTRQFSRWIWWN